MPEPFRHTESERTIVFGAGALAGSLDLLGRGYTLLTTPRAAAAAPAVAERAGTVVHVPAGPVDIVAAGLRGAVDGQRLVALGGGRVVDVAKALAAADPPREVAAVPTSLSAAEMTGAHRHVQGVPAETPHVRPVLVVNDPELSGSQPVPGLAASSANALAHAIAALFVDGSTPIARAVAGEAVQRLAAGWSGTEPDRGELALGALLAGWAVDHSGLGPHHALAQTAVRTASVGHGQANAALLPATVEAIRERRPAEVERVEARLGIHLGRVAVRLRERSGADVGALHAEEGLLTRAVEAAAKRPELARIPPAPDRAEIRGIYLRS